MDTNKSTIISVHTRDDIVKSFLNVLPFDYNIRVENLFEISQSFPRDCIKDSCVFADYLCTDFVYRRALTYT